MKIFVIHDYYFFPVNSLNLILVTLALNIFLFLIKVTVSWDRFQKFWQKFTELGLTKGRGWFLNFLWASMILKYKKFVYCG